MRKTFVGLLCAIALLAIYSCSSDESRVKSVFKDYVQSNFDDPNDLLEIVSVKATDTLSESNIFQELTIKKDGCEKLKKECDEICLKFGSLPESEFDKALSFDDGDTYYRYNELGINLKDDDLKSLRKRYEELVKHKISSSKKILFEIKVRMKEDNKKKLDFFYAVCDTTLRNIQIREYAPSSCELFRGDVQKGQELMDEYISLSESYAEEIRLAKSLIEHSN